MLSVIKKFRLKTHRIILDRKLKKLSVARVSKNLDTAKRIGILFDASRPENQVFVNNYRKSLINRRKRVEMLGYFDDKRVHKNVIFRYYTNKDISWFWIPKNRDVEHFLETKYDILINLFLEPKPHFEYISAMSQASMRIGPFHEDREHCYDLMINNPKNQDMKTYVDQIYHYLNLIHSDEP